MQFKVGDKVFYPGRGLCEIRDISTQQLDGDDVELYHLVFLVDEATVMVPVPKAHDIGIRRLLDKSEVPKVYAFLQQHVEAPSRDYKIRYRKNVDLLASGTILDVADVVKSLAYLSSMKKLTERESEMLERARALLINEIAQVTGTEPNEVQAQLDQTLAEFQVEG